MTYLSSGIVILFFTMIFLTTIPNYLRNSKMSNFDRAVSCDPYHSKILWKARKYSKIPENSKILLKVPNSQKIIPIYWIY